MHQNLKDLNDFVVGLYAAYEIKIILYAGVAGGLIAKAVGGFDKQLIGLLIFMAADYITGMYAAWHSHDLWSKKAFRGLCKKASILGVVAFCYGIDVVFGSNVCRYGAIAGFGVMEALSIIENADRGGWGAMFPAWIREKLAVIKDSKKLE
ncbi:MAG: phage holin family protein [Acidaminococcaceae bacterium]